MLSIVEGQYHNRKRNNGHLNRICSFDNRRSRRQYGTQPPYALLGETVLYCYRVWFDDGSTVLVNAENKKDADSKAWESFGPEDRGDIVKVECLS